jgi:hypothetical protein
MGLFGLFLLDSTNHFCELLKNIFVLTTSIKLDNIYFDEISTCMSIIIYTRVVLTTTKDPIVYLHIIIYVHKIRTTLTDVCTSNQCKQSASKKINTSRVLHFYEFFRIFSSIKSVLRFAQEIKCNYGCFLGFLQN